LAHRRAKLRFGPLRPTLQVAVMRHRLSPPAQTHIELQQLEMALLG